MYLSSHQLERDKEPETLQQVCSRVLEANNVVRKPAERPIQNLNPKSCASVKTSLCNVYHGLYHTPLCRNVAFSTPFLSMFHWLNMHVCGRGITIAYTLQ